MARDQEYRRNVAALARRVRAGDLKFFAFIEAVGSEDDPYETGDEDVNELIDLFEHEPAVGPWWLFFLRVTPEMRAAHLAKTDALIEKLAR